MNNLTSSSSSSGWRAFPPSDFTTPSTTRRSITKNPTTLFQNLPPSNSNSSLSPKSSSPLSTPNVFGSLQYDYGVNVRNSGLFTESSRRHVGSSLGVGLSRAQLLYSNGDSAGGRGNENEEIVSFDTGGGFTSSPPLKCESHYERSTSCIEPTHGDVFGRVFGESVSSLGSPMKIGTWNSSSSSLEGKAFPTMGNFEIGTFNISSTTTNNNNNCGGSSSSSNNNNTSGPGIRETGIIEKLLHSYGFIQCCDRQARLFFHFSQFDGNIEHLKIGDPVEFEMTYDRRTGKPIASTVSKISPEVVLNEERVTGTVTTESRLDTETDNWTQGRISYENCGECFFLPFTKADVEGNVTVSSGDKVSFQMATMQRTGNLVARTIRFENPVSPVKYQGVVNSIKDSFGFIERSDVVKEIFFHISESELKLNLGDDVEFTIQSRNNKEVACNITKLISGTVVFEDVDNVYFTGQVLKPIDRNASENGGDPLQGRVKYRGKDRSEIEIPFGEKDQIGDFTLRHGDWVKFVIAIDRRDKLQRATKIALLDESFRVSDERREQGVIQTLKDGFGFIKCADRDARIFFHFNECLDVERVLQVGDDVEFTVTKDNSQRLLATRIKHLLNGAVSFDSILHRNITGRVEVEPPLSSSRSEDGPGKIVYELNGTRLEIPLYAEDCDLRNTPHLNDIVSFDINQLKSTRETKAINVTVLSSAEEDKSFTKVYHGYIAALKDGFGFVETLEHDKEIFFHFSKVDGNKLEIGLEVEYCLSTPDTKDKKVSAEKVKALPRGTIEPIKARPDVVNGKVIRTLRSVNPDQEQYCGLIQVRSEDGKVLAEYEFGIASLFNKKELLQIRDPVQFQISELGNFAVNIKATREKLRATVEAVKGQYGFLSHEVDEGKKLFFHMSEVESGDTLQQGDQVEFVVVTNKRTGKHSGCCVKKISSLTRPDRLISRLKTTNLEGPKVVIIRQPKGPDGSTGFKSRSSVAAMALLDELD